MPAASVQSLRDRLSKVFRQERGHDYAWDFQDEHALRRVLANGDDEIARRWGVALRRDRYPECSSIKDLVKHWNSYATERPRKGPDIRRDPIRAEDMKHPDEVGEIHDF
jgi:hypothetical protein